MKWFPRGILQTNSGHDFHSLFHSLKSTEFNCVVCCFLKLLLSYQLLLQNNGSE